MIRQHSSTLALTAALAAIAILLTACSDDADAPAVSQPGSSEPASSEPATDDGRPVATTAPEVDYSIIGDVFQYGPGRWALAAAGDPAAPMAVFDVPNGFQGHESFVWTDHGRGADRVFGQLTYWTATRVPEDPCNADEPSPPVGRTVESLAAALIAQRRTTTTEPARVELDGHRGLYLELQTPRHFDYAACGPEEAMLIWGTGKRHDGRYLAEPVTDRYWIMNVGERRPVVLAALTFRGANNAAVELITGVAETTTFVAPE